MNKEFFIEQLAKLQIQFDDLEKKYETMRLATLEWGKDVDMVKRWGDQHLRRIEGLEATVGLRSAPEYSSRAQRLIEEFEEGETIREGISNVLWHLVCAWDRCSNDNTLEGVPCSVLKELADELIIPRKTNPTG